MRHGLRGRLLLLLLVVLVLVGDGQLVASAVVAPAALPAHAPVVMPVDVIIVIIRLQVLVTAAAGVPGARGALRGVTLSGEPCAGQVHPRHSRRCRARAVIAPAVVVQAPEVGVACVVPGVGEGAVPCTAGVVSAAAGGPR